MTNFSKILNSLSGMFSEDRNKYLASFGEFDLLIIDDLGIERNSEYAQEQVYNVVDSRYLSRLPFIITTNLTLTELKEPKDIAHARIYAPATAKCGNGDMDVLALSFEDCYTERKRRDWMEVELWKVLNS